MIRYSNFSTIEYSALKMHFCTTVLVKFPYGMKLCFLPGTSSYTGKDVQSLESFDLINGE